MMKSSTRRMLVALAAVVLLSAGTVSLLLASDPNCDTKEATVPCNNSACAKSLASMGCPQNPGCTGTNQNLYSGPFTCVLSGNDYTECLPALDINGDPLPWYCMSFSQCYYSGTGFGSCLPGGPTTYCYSPYYYDYLCP